jgi:hypothetical protein
VSAEVTDPCGGEQGVAGGVGRHVAVGVPREALVLLRPLEPGQVHRYAGGEPVHVHADPHAGQRWDVTVA